MAKKLGASKVIDYENEDYTAIETRYTAVFDAVGKSRFSEAKKVLTPNGVYMSSELGPYAQNPFLALKSKLYGSKKVLFPIPSNKKENLIRISKMIKSGSLNPLIDGVRDFSDAIDATTYVEAGQKVGSVVLEIKK